MNQNDKNDLRALVTAVREANLSSDTMHKLIGIVMGIGISQNLAK